MFAGIFGIVIIMVLLFVVAFVAVYLFKIDLVETVLGDMDIFWEDRAWWGRTPRRRPRPKDPARKGQKRKKRSARDEADEARDAAIKAARWPYE